MVPCVLALLKSIKRYYDLLDAQLRDDSPVDSQGLQPLIAVMPLQRWDRLADKAVRYALLLSPEVIAIHLTKLEGPIPRNISAGCGGNGGTMSSARRERPAQTA